MTTISRFMSVALFGPRSISEWGVSLAKLSAPDRQLAERWIREAGAESFVRIVLGVAKSRKPKEGRSTLVREELLIEAAVELSKNPGMALTTAAKKIALRHKQPGLKTWIFRHLKLRDPERLLRRDRQAAIWEAARARSGSRNP